MYVGAEVAIGSLLVNYFKEPYTLGLAESEGSKLMARYWLCAMVGRFIGSLFTLRNVRARQGADRARADRRAAGRAHRC